MSNYHKHLVNICAVIFCIRQHCWDHFMNAMLLFRSTRFAFCIWRIFRWKYQVNAAHEISVPWNKFFLWEIKNIHNIVHLRLLFVSYVDFREHRRGFIENKWVFHSLDMKKNGSNVFGRTHCANNTNHKLNWHRLHRLNASVYALSLSLPLSFFFSLSNLSYISRTIAPFHA